MHTLETLWAEYICSLIGEELFEPWFSDLYQNFWRKKNNSTQLYGTIWLSILIKLWISINKIYCELGWNILPQWSYSISAPSVLQPGVKYLHICDQGSHSGASEDWWLHDLVYCICTLGLTNWARRKSMNIELIISYLFKILKWKSSLHQICMQTWTTCMEESLQIDL